MELDENIARSSICESSSSFFGGWAEGTVFTFNCAKKTINSYSNKVERSIGIGGAQNQDVDICRMEQKKGVFGKLKQWIDKDNRRWKEDKIRFIKQVNAHSKTEGKHANAKAILTYHGDEGYYRLNTRYTDHNGQAEEHHNNILVKIVPEHQNIKGRETDRVTDHCYGKSDFAPATRFAEIDPPRSFISIKKLVSTNKNEVPEKRTKNPRENPRIPEYAYQCARFKGNYELRKSLSPAKKAYELRNGFKARVSAKLMDQKSDDMAKEPIQGKLLKVYGGCVCMVNQSSMQETMIISEKKTLKVLQNMTDVRNNEVIHPEKVDSVPSETSKLQMSVKKWNDDGVYSSPMRSLRGSSEDLVVRKADKAERNCVCVPTQSLVCDACVTILRKANQEANAKRRFKYRGNFGHNMTYRSLFGKRAIYDPGVGKESQAIFVTTVKKRKQDKSMGNVNNPTETFESTFSSIVAADDTSRLSKQQQSFDESQSNEHDIVNLKSIVKRCKIPSETPSPRSESTELLISLQKQQEEAERSSIQILEERMLKAFEKEIDKMHKNSPMLTRKEAYQQTVSQAELENTKNEEFTGAALRNELEFKLQFPELVNLDSGLSRIHVKPEEMFPELISVPNIILIHQNVLKGHSCIQKTCLVESVVSFIITFQDAIQLLSNLINKVLILHILVTMHMPKTSFWNGFHMRVMSLSTIIDSSIRLTVEIPNEINTLPRHHQVFNI
ncbi:hypothetical protein SELMODRAFT_429460 [Selaginella moellendorffii]|uniref:Uncharacterized protein n=1 Tax=Selaginella moellendorffii TaxID=88036 RepID=D8T696_SELML|nr:hypothetical protein SELMODRAFT_429460 [Selaginella moellendorffii]